MTIRLTQRDDVITLQNLNDEVFVDNHKYDPDLKTDWSQSETGRKYGVCKNCQRQWGQILPAKEPLNITVLNNTVKSCEDAFSD